MSVKFEVNFESLFERLVDHTDGDDINDVFLVTTMKYVLPFSLRDKYRDRV